ncbi:proline--tRNA ligase [Candidatus Kuenenbacteria bacterium HGW-Kuenenbacteria-1]|uniref:Proline--tRNA ligase n=1 Tax=Candidatus Kuenenbacteria bacterium HGW-Kuenenbacteria-1 TaxID=2013812 RepID=A0A2N1UP17_9BACT|nr:MAG: proline--tRNA ligase [Candidatus Kuenenbacteria bacterium HGW-Kuenenbacteria-1]
MRFSRYFLKTSKTVSNDDKIISSKLLKQGGFISESVAGRYYFLPIGHLVQQKIMQIIKEEMDNTDYQEMITPILHPLELWEETNRTSSAGFELMKVKDRRGAEFALGGTAEEMFVDLIRQFKLSYRDLPIRLYQFSPKFRDELRARGGLLRVREFIMKDGYSFHRDEEDFKIEYEKMKKVYFRIFEHLGLKTEIVESDNGYIGGEYCHEFVVESEIGEDKYFISENKNYVSQEDTALFKKEDKNSNEKLLALIEVRAERGLTMEHGVKFHNLPLWQQIKDVVFVDENGQFILAIIRGDFDVNEIKLKKILKIVTLRHATDEEIREKLYSEPGFISPVKIKDLLEKNVKLIIIADNSLRTITNAYGGSNKKNKDLMNINIDRDYQPDIEGDIALVKNGYESLNENGKLIEKRGIEVGNIFQLGYHYTNLMKGAVYMDVDGKEKPFYMGCYGIGIGRTMATIVEKFHDEKGIIWPEAVAPFQVYLIALVGAEKEADKLYDAMIKKGIEVLYDDRENMRAGEKFADADLIGIPLRIVISEKTLKENCVELKRRGQEKFELIKIKDLLKTVFNNFNKGI